ncbi:MAG TPA: ABC transporter permease subunit [Candidatus Dormibacteraeota bacterium]|nr:ABC transporter permease subunit [Candidatus Dormibacteraeota bacterium]
MTSLLLGLRLSRWGIAGFSLVAFILTLIQTVGFYQIAGHTPAERAVFGQSMARLAAEFVALFPPPLHPETVEGYVQFRGFSPLTILFAVWALTSATGFARGDEERGVVEATLASGTSRPALVAARVASFALGVAVASAAAGAGFVVGAASGGESVPAAGSIEACALVAAVGFACYGVALLAAQFATARAATALAGALLLSLFLANSLSRVLTWLSTWRWLSPFRYYELSQPLPPGGYFDVRGFVVLIGIGLVAAAAAGVAFTRRDIGAPVVRLPSAPHRRSYDAANMPAWRIPVVRGLYERRLGVLAWAAGMAAIAAIFVALTRTIVQVLLSIPTLRGYLSIFVHQQLYPAVLGYTYFDVAELMFAAFAIVQVARWSAEDTDGRLELMLSEPISRAAVVVERMAVLLVGALIVTGVAGLTLFYASHYQGIDLNGQRVVGASLMLVVFALVFAGAGSLLAAWNPRAAVGLVGGFAFASYLDNELATIYKLPAWVQDLSAFKLFGTPLLTGVDNRSLALMLLLALAGLGSSILVMQRRDVGG